MKRVEKVNLLLRNAYWEVKKVSALTLLYSDFVKHGEVKIIAKLQSGFNFDNIFLF